MQISDRKIDLIACSDDIAYFQAILRDSFKLNIGAKY